MVSIKNGLTIAAALAGIAVFMGVGGAKGLGERVGGSFRQFSNSFIAGLGINPLATEQNNINTGTAFDQAIQAIKNTGTAITPEIARNTAAIITPPKTAVAAAFTPAAAAGAISQGFAERYSFQPPTKTGVLDVSNIFRHINQNTHLQTRAASNFGGYGSAVNQNTALAQAIEASAAQYGEYFG